MLSLKKRSREEFFYFFFCEGGRRETQKNREAEGERGKGEQERLNTRFLDEFVSSKFLSSRKVGFWVTTEGALHYLGFNEELCT